VIGSARTLATAAIARLETVKKTAVGRTDGRTATGAYTRTGCDRAIGHARITDNIHEIVSAAVVSRTRDLGDFNNGSARVRHARARRHRDDIGPTRRLRLAPTRRAFATCRNRERDLPRAKPRRGRTNFDRGRHAGGTITRDHRFTIPKFGEKKLAI